MIISGKKKNIKSAQNRSISIEIWPEKSRNLCSMAAWRRNVIKAVENRKPARRLGWEQKRVLDKTATLRKLKILRNLTFSRDLLTEGLKKVLQYTATLHILITTEITEKYEKLNLFQYQYIRSNMTGQHDWQEQRSTPQSESGHCPLTGRYFGPCPYLHLLLTNGKAFTHLSRMLNTCKCAVFLI